MFSAARYLLSDLGYWMRTHPARAALGLLLVAGLAAGGYFGVQALTEDETSPIAAAPKVIVRTEEAPEAPADLGFPAFATSNTTRVAGADSVATAAAVALATFPSTAGAAGPNAVTLVPVDDWAAGVAAAALVATPVDAPILLTDGDELPELTEDALASLAPRGAPETQGRQVFAVGSAPEPQGARGLRVEGANVAEVAAEVARLRERLTDAPPGHLLIASSDDAAFAMPAAAWAARSGDPVLFAQRDSVPDATLETLDRYRDVPVYIVGPESVISSKAEKQIAKVTRTPVRRAATDEDPVENAIEFARYVDGTFGWNINDPGHGFVIATTGRPADAGAAAALSGSGTWGPLLLTDDAVDLPAPLESYLLDLKPGYDDDPTRAVYNHVWIVGDESAISTDLQVQVDEIAELAPVRSGQGEPSLGPAPGTPEPEGQRRGDQNQDGNRNR